MAFDYGSIDLGIRNPFKVEGTIRAVAGGVMLLMGVLSLLAVQGLVQAGSREEGIANAVVGFALTAWGLHKLGAGLFQVFRFFVGRSVPASLAPNLEKSQLAKRELVPAYTAQQLEQMLQGRQNISFEEPNDWFSRLIHSIFRRLLYLPYAYRNMAQRLARAITQTAIALLSYALAWFSGTTGITDITSTPVMDWLALLLATYLLIVWLRASPPLPRLLNEGAGSMPGAMTLTLWIGAAIALPVLLSTMHSSVTALPALPIGPGGFILSVVALGALCAGLLGALINARSRTSNPQVEVSEYRDSWQESIHPQEVFIHFENIVMANRRYKEVPNRLYRGFAPQLLEQGSDDKGDFGGEMIQEIQPVFHALPTAPVFQLIRIFGSVAGALLLTVAAVLSFLLPGYIAEAQNTTPVAMATAIAPILVYAVIFGLFGRLLSNMSHAFWAEMQFESLIVYFQCKGTYTESKLSTGTSIYDSTRSENIVVRSSMTPWIITTRAISSTFATSGSLNLELQRYVLEMHKAQTDLDTIVDDIRQFVSKREAIASINNEKDLAAASRIFQVNQQSRAKLEQKGEPSVDHQRISEHSGADDPEQKPSGRGDGAISLDP